MPSRSRLAHAARTALVAVVTASTVVAGARRASAQPTPESDASSEYKRHMDNGIKLYRAGDFDAAQAEFQAAYREEPKASPLLNVALCQREAKKYPDAIKTLERAIADHGTTMDPAAREGAAKAIDEMRALLGFVTVRTEPERARVTIDGAALVPGGHPVAPGVHVVVVEAEGFATSTTEVTVASQERAAVTIALVPVMGSIKILARKASTVILVDGQKRGTWSWSGPLPVGSHTVELVGESPPTTVAIRRGEESLVDNRPRAAPPTGAEPLVEKGEPHGFYGMITGAILIPFRHPVPFEGASVSSGANAALRAGYRVNTVAAFEAMIEYGNITNSIEVDTRGPDPEYSFTSWRFGPMLRLMSPGDTLRFVGTLGGGLAVDLMSYDDLGSCAPRCDDTYGFDFYVTTDAGTELSIGGVLLGAALTFTLQGTKGSDDFTDDEDKAIRQPYGNRVLPMFGPRVHFGYAFW